MSNPGLQLVPSLTHAPRHDHGGHVVQLYTDDGFLIDVLSRFIGGALAVGDAAVGHGHWGGCDKRGAGLRDLTTHSEGWTGCRLPRNCCSSRIVKSDPCF